MSDSDKMKEGKNMSGLKFPKEENEEKKGCPIGQHSRKPERKNVICADGTHRPKSIIFLADLTEHYPNNMD